MPSHVTRYTDDCLATRQKLFNDGYSATDIITTLFRIVRNADLQEWIKLEYIKVFHLARVHRSALEFSLPGSVQVVAASVTSAECVL